MPLRTIAAGILCAASLSFGLALSSADGSGPEASHGRPTTGEAPPARPPYPIATTESAGTSMYKILDMM